MIYLPTIFIGIISALLPLMAGAQTFPPVACEGFPGCGEALENVIATSAIPLVARLLLNSIAALALIFVIIGGARYLISFGREEEQGKAFKTISAAFGGLIIALTSHRIVTLVTTEAYLAGTTGDPLFNFFQSVVRIMVTLLNVSFLIVIVYGGFRMLAARGKDEDVNKGRNAIFFAIVGAIIINVAPVVVKGLLNL